MLDKQIEAVGLNTKRKKGLTPNEKWDKGKDRYNQQRKEKYQAEKDETNRKRRENYEADETIRQKRKEKHHTAKLTRQEKEKELLKKTFYDYFPLWNSGYPIYDREILCLGCSEKGIPRWKIQFCGENCRKRQIATNAKIDHDGLNWSEKQKKELFLIAELNSKIQEKKTAKQKRLATTKKDIKVSNDKIPPYNPPYYLLKEDLLTVNPKRKEKGVVVKPKTVSNENLPVVKPPLTKQGTKLFRQITEMLNSPMVKVKIGVDKYGSLWWNKNWPKLFTKDDINELMKGKTINWRIPMEDGLPKWVKVKLVLGIRGGAKVEWEGKWYWLYIVDHDFLKTHINPRLQQRLKINVLNAMEKLGCWFNETEHGIHHYILSETQWPANVKLLWKDKFNQYFETGDVIQEGRCALFIGSPNKVFNPNGGEMTIVKDFKEIQTLYHQPPFYAELITKEEIIKSKLKIKTFQPTQTILEKKPEEVVMNEINENNTCLMTKMLEYIQEKFKQKNSYIVKTQPQICWSGKSRRGFYLMKIMNLLTNQEMWVYLPIFGYDCYGVSGRKKPNIYKGGIFSLNLKQGNNLTFITNYTVC